MDWRFETLWFWDGGGFELIREMVALSMMLFVQTTNFNRIQARRHYVLQDRVSDDFGVPRILGGEDSLKYNNGFLPAQRHPPRCLQII